MTPEIAAHPAVAAPLPAREAGRPGKVLVVGSSLRVGGAEAMSVALANALAAEGTEVYYASAGGALRDSIDARVQYLPTDHPGHAPSRVTHELLLYIKHHRFDVIHAHGGSSAVMAALAARASHQHPARVLTHHRRVFHRAPRWLSARVMQRCADHFIAINGEKQAELEALSIPRERISLIPGFVDVDAIATRVASCERGPTLREMGIPEGARVLLMAGRVVAPRRFDDFVRVCAEVARRQKDREVHGLVVGEGPDLVDVRRTAAREAAPAQVHFLGYQKNPLPYLAACDVVVYPSALTEALPVFLIEACAAGKPIVCSDLPAHREIVTDGETGRIVGGAIADYAEAAVALLEHPETGAVYAHAAQQRALRRFDSHAVAHETLAVYCNLIATR